ncbi:fumarylacetoacetate hydrolase family protein [Desulfuromonas acetoxidans]|uniref:5-oxopent-3-ene-1,2,5-tricarboxylate decarboxylase n=1 Tax=Desulfuromonas acetoxidans (strain DSM 684 / 11070) TaxID=281689 RepID=Q1K041_DESA6|nr:fumarylacetoacetate hydrolase family protein [Desulfuromonas acetoxidans]EAT15701.1 5-oxopent-3-ene-1,2,5-tricarboxylate decarboxylase [Desulfuromonas acetoxidans DSM 684]MBF0646624.1 fumarylacetoacetate hydrolase family protein [Desulfuromonas acetoxidans]NVD26069.1 fumarylacetoacetate hydrolase family protein [Desulfuromonas acetoxidans]NVE16941.1 fumarylacetoacetate hydrolase family protein [Desulfuromonas acetoxidans]
MHHITLQGESQPIAVGKIVCLARNYVAHAKELGNEVPSDPVLFIKPTTSMINDGETMVIPGYSDDCHHEVELAVLIGRTAHNVSAEEAMDYVAGYGIGIDMTLRDTQAVLKEKGYPWELAKGFDTSCPLSEFVPADRVGDPHDLAIRLQVNGEVRQDANTGLMIRRIPETIAAITRAFTLEPGDLILTGTPAGVGRVVAGDKMLAEIEGIGTLQVDVR